MTSVSVLASNGTDGYVKGQEVKSLLRFITCGSVDDGKSTLIGRLLYESHMLFEDQLAALESDSKRVGTQGGALDFALLLDGLSAEREQGITIDVAYRFFATDTRKFIVADTPGHEQYTRNMVTGASTADAAVILVDAQKGVLTQTKRHSYLVRLLGIGKIVVAINKLDLVGYSRDVFDQIEVDYLEFARRIGLDDVTCIPMSALRGDNVTRPSAETPWYRGPTLMGWLEIVDVADTTSARPFRMPVQWVNRPHMNFRGFSGQIASGAVRVGDRVRVVPAGAESVVAGIVTFDGNPDVAVRGESVTITLRDEIDVSRGHVLCDATAPAPAADQLQAHAVWMSEAEMLPGRPYLYKFGTQTVGGSMSRPKYKLNVNTLEHTSAVTLALNEIGVVDVALDRPVAFETYAHDRQMGGFIIIDRLTNETVGAGMIDFALRRSHTVPWQTIEVNKEAHLTLNGHRPCIVWFTGIAGAGKSTIANLVERRLHAGGAHTYLIDGDNIRHGLSKELGFTDADRVENVRRIAQVAQLMVDAGLIVLVSAISPFRAEREMARRLVAEGEFCEVFVDTALATAEGRDTKGLYEQARHGQLANFTGLDSAYEPPHKPELHIDTSHHEPNQAAEKVVEWLNNAGVLAGSGVHCPPHLP